MPSSAQTPGSTESNADVLKHEKEQLMNTSSPQQDINMLLVSLFVLKRTFCLKN